jgi:hypothetical protein
VTLGFEHGCRADQDEDANEITVSKISGVVLCAVMAASLARQMLFGR